MRSLFDILRLLLNVIAWCTAALVAGFVCYIAASEAIHSNLLRVNGPIWQWQTLIAGILAIAAAVATIQQMRNSDRAQEKRHYEIITMSLKQDRMIAFKAVVPHLNDMGRYLQSCLTLLTGGRPQDADQYRRLMKQIHEAFAGLISLLNHPDVRAAGHLYDINLRHAFIDIDRSLPLFEKASEEAGIMSLEKRTDGGINNRAFDPMQLQTSLITAQIAFGEIEPACESLISALGGLFSSYEDMFRSN